MVENWPKVVFGSNWPVARIHAVGETYEMEMELDVNTELYPITEEAERHRVVLAPTLALDGTADSGVWDPHRDPGLMENYDYVMHGKVFKWSEDKSASRKV